MPRTRASSERDCFLGLDCGTQSAKAGLWTVSGRRLALGSSPLEVSSPRPEWAEQDSRDWWRSSCAAIRACCAGEDASRIVALGVAFQRESFTLNDSRGTPLRPALLWLDIRAGEDVASLAPVAQDLHARTGKPVDVTVSLPRLLWLRRHEPELFAGSPLWTDVGSELFRRLTGRRVTCVSGADTAGMIDLARRDWSREVLDLAGLDLRQVPELVEPADIVGRLTAEAARETGLEAGIPVVAAGGDGQVFAASVLGCARDAGVSLTLGTSVVAAIPSREPSVSHGYRTLFAAIPDRSYLLEAVIQSGSYLIRWLERLFPAGAATGAARWEEEARKLPPGSGGLVTVPHWWGTRFPDASPGSRGATLGWADHHGAAHLYRSILEGVALELRYCLCSFLGRAAPAGAPGLTAGGGGAQSRLWRSIIADVLGMPVREAEEESVALGAAMLAALGTGYAATFADAAGRFAQGRPWEPPDRRNRERYAELYARVYAPLRETAVTLSTELTRIAFPGGSS